MAFRHVDQDFATVETDPLLEPVFGEHDGLSAHETVGGIDQSGEQFDHVPAEKRQLGLTSAVFLITNRIVGTGIYATPSIILSSAGSIGMALIMWLIGAGVAAVGSAVYTELGTALPRSGGEKVYLEYIYDKPKLLISCLYATWALFMLSAGGNSMVFADYALRSLDLEPSLWLKRTVAVCCLTSVLIIHSTQVKLGLRLQNIFGLCGLCSLVTVAVSGILVLFSVISLADDRPSPSNFRDPWSGTNTNINAVVTGLFSVMWSYKGYNNANYALSETKDPIRTLKIAVPTALGAVIALYLLVNIAYFSVVDKAEIIQNGQIVAALFFRNLYGTNAGQIASAVVAMSTFGNILSIIFAQSRVVQELAREGILPFSALLASNKPWGTPLAAIGEQWLIATLAVLVPSAGDAYAFVLNLTIYPFNLANFLVSLGVIGLNYPELRRKLGFVQSSSDFTWSPPFRAWKLATFSFTIANMFLIIAPFVPPTPGHEPYKRLPYWLHAVSVLALSLIGAFYWFMRFLWIPQYQGYKLVREEILQEDGVPRFLFRKIKR